MTTFADYVPPPPPTEGDTFKPIENTGKVLIVQVSEYKPSIVTPNSPEGGPGIIVDLVDLSGPTTYRDVLWMSSAVVDGLKSHAGTRKPILITFRAVKSKSGRSYPVPDPVDAAAIARATAYYAANGDPFAASFGAPAPAEAEPPF